MALNLASTQSPGISGDLLGNGANQNGSPGGTEGAGVVEDPGFIEGLIAFVLEGKEGGILMLMLASAALAVLIVLLNWIYQKATGNLGFLEMGEVHPFATLVFWPIGASFTALLGDILNILQSNRQVALVVAIAWTVLLPRIVDMAKARAGEFDEPGDPTE